MTLIVIDHVNLRTPARLVSSRKNAEVNQIRKNQMNFHLSGQAVMASLLPSDLQSDLQNG